MLGGHARLSRIEFLTLSTNTDRAPAVCQCCSGHWGALGTNKSVISMNDKGSAEKQIRLKGWRTMGWGAFCSGAVRKAFLSKDLKKSEGTGGADIWVRSF